jgi:predicted nucleic acid-binding protein
MIYVDTSVIVSALTNEQATAASQRWLTTQKPGRLAISHWTITEFSAALSIKTRIGSLTLNDRAFAIAEFARWRPRYFLSLEIASAAFERAAQLCERVEAGLRASDALHLAIVQERGADLCTLDERLASAATAIGVQVVRPA